MHQYLITCHRSQKYQTCCISVYYWHTKKMHKTLFMTNEDILSFICIIKEISLTKCQTFYEHRCCIPCLTAKSKTYWSSMVFYIDTNQRKLKWFHTRKYILWYQNVDLHIRITGLIVDPKRTYAKMKKHDLKIKLIYSMDHSNAERIETSSVISKRKFITDLKWYRYNAKNKLKLNVLMYNCNNLYT